uniref:Uncharacterized protein n=1 Tax=Arundo donax TaxID=35708 RepID=A0A0A8ZF39_ARUDO
MQMRYKETGVVLCDSGLTF